MERQRIRHSGFPILDHPPLVWKTVARDILPTAWPHPCISCTCLHHCGQERPIWVRAGGPDLPGRQGSGRCVPVPPATRTAHPTFALDSHPQWPAQLSLGAGGGRCKRHELVPQVRNIPNSLFWCSDLQAVYVTFWHWCFETVCTLCSESTDPQKFCTFWCQRFTSYTVNYDVTVSQNCRTCSGTRASEHSVQYVLVSQLWNTI
jgi:hypothetical protein